MQKRSGHRMLMVEIAGEKLRAGMSYMSDDGPPHNSDDDLQSAQDTLQAEKDLTCLGYCLAQAAFRP